MIGSIKAKPAAGSGVTAEPSQPTSLPMAKERHPSGEEGMEISKPEPRRSPGTIDSADGVDGPYCVRGFLEEVFRGLQKGYEVVSTAREDLEQMKALLVERVAEVGGAVSFEPDVTCGRADRRVPDEAAMCWQDATVSGIRRRPGFGAGTVMHFAQRCADVEYLE